MKEKYCYESVNDEIARHDVLLFISLLLFIFALIKRESVSNKVFFTLISISILMFVCWIGFFEMQGFFIADDDAVTFGRIFKRRIEYSSIKSISLSKAIRTYRSSSGYRAKTHRKYASLVETITFHCEEGDYSFTDVLVPYREYKSPGEPMVMYNNDWSNSAFSRLKNFIESNE